jgi:hypothetical protein
MKNLLYFLAIAGTIGILATCNNQPAPPEQVEEEVVNSGADYLEQGAEIAATSFTVLSGRLMAAMKKDGVPEAVQYCNLAGLPLMDSLSQAHQVNIRRTALKIRQPKDAPTLAEKKALDQYHAQFAAGEVLKPFVETISAEEVAFYAPILVSEACLKCHGKLGETLKEEDYQLIKELYPDDQAIGYASGDLRGMWSITFATKASSQK